MDDYGGGYSESITEMCEELQNGSLPLLIPTPNGRDDTGANRDCFILNPAVKSSLHTRMFNFLGKVSRILVYDIMYLRGTHLSFPSEVHFEISRHRHRDIRIYRF